MVCDNFQDGHRCVPVFAHAVEKFDAGSCGTAVDLDHVEDAPGGVVFDRQHLVSPIVLVPVHVDGHSGVFPLEANPWPSASLLVRIFVHVFCLQEDRVDTVVSDRDIVSVAEDVGDGHCTSAEALMQFEDAIFEIVGVVCVWFSTRRFQLWDVSSVAVLFSELLNPPLTDLELLGNERCGEIVINNTLTDPGDIVLVKLHFTWSIVGEIMPTKSLADTTLDREVMDAFEMPSKSAKPTEVPSKADLKTFYDELENPKYKTIFLFAATSGLRSSELTGLTMDDIDEDKRMPVSKRPSSTVSSRSPCLAADCSDHDRHAETHTHP